ncbi:MAG: 5,10-methylenetetrahydrofolate reductase [Turneriella sp.]
MSSDWTALRLTYGITPPKLSTPEPRRREIAAAQAARIAKLPIDALVVYDLQDESSRTDAERPFPFLRAIDPLDYAYDYLDSVAQPKIIYRSVSGSGETELVDWLTRLHGLGGAAVLVGAPSRSQAVSLHLGDAYRARSAQVPALALGGVAIAERHEARGAEDERVLGKVDQGCRFFITQAVYSVTASKNLLSDLHYRCAAAGRPVPPLLVTLSPCGSKKTLEFMAWLGVSVPRLLQNELLQAHDILEKSIELCVQTFSELSEFAREKNIRLGCNVESVSLNKAEIEASVELVGRIQAILNAKE